MEKMEKVKVCLHWSYITVTSLIGITSAILLGCSLFSHVHLIWSYEMLPGLYCLYAFSIVSLLLTIIGLFGACKKKMWALIVFAVGMILASLFMLVVGVQGTGESELAEARQKVLLNVGSLVHTSDRLQDTLKEAQTENRCCGLDQGYVDWGYDIPESCLCTSRSEPCVAAPNDSMLFEKRTNDQPIMIYKKPCLYFLMEEVYYTRIMLYGVRAFIFFWALSAALCIFILCQMKKREDTSAVV